MKLRELEQRWWFHVSLAAATTVVLTYLEARYSLWCWLLG